MDLARGRLRSQEVLGRQHLIDGLEGVDDPLRVEDGDLLARRRVAQLNAHEEPVELRLGERERPFVLDRVLRRHDEERLRQLVGGAVDGYLVLVHRLEEGRLGLRRRPVDLVGQDDLAHDRSGTELELVGLLVEDRDSGHVGRQEVRGELDPPEGAPERPGEGLGQNGLPGPGDVLDEDVAAAQKRDERELDLVVLAENHPLDVLDYAADFRRESFLHRATYPSSLRSRPLLRVSGLLRKQRRRTLSSYTGPRLFWFHGPTSRRV